MANRQYPELFTTFQEVNRVLRLGADGVRVGTSVSYLNPLEGEGAGLALYWRTAVWDSLRFREIRSHWGLNLQKLCVDVYVDDASELSFAVFHGYDRNTLLERYQGSEVISVGPSASNRSTLVRDMVESITGRMAGSASRTGARVGEALGAHLGNLLGKGLRFSPGAFPWDFPLG